LLSLGGSVGSIAAQGITKGFFYFKEKNMLTKDQVSRIDCLQRVQRSHVDTLEKLLGRLEAIKSGNEESTFYCEIGYPKHGRFTIAPSKSNIPLIKKIFETQLDERCKELSRDIEERNVQINMIIQGDDSEA
jgi:hypothetical protein